MTLASRLVWSLYGLKCVLKLYTMRRAYGRSPWNVFDAVIILASILTEFAEGIPGVSSLRDLKLARLEKLFHVMSNFPALYLTVKRFVSSIGTILWASVLFAVLGLL